MGPTPDCWQPLPAVAHRKGTAFPSSRGNGEADSGWLEVNWSSVMAHPAGAALRRPRVSGDWVQHQRLQEEGGRWRVQSLTH